MFDGDAADQMERVVTVMQDIENLCTTLFKLHYGSVYEPEESEFAPRRELHVQEVDSMSQFGEKVLTERERIVAQNLLRGHSAKSMARLLDISPGTISIHRSNVYKKMEVSSQAELSSLFLQQLMGPDLR